MKLVINVRLPESFVAAEKAGVLELGAAPVDEAEDKPELELEPGVDMEDTPEEAPISVSVSEVADAVEDSGEAVDASDAG